MNTGILLDSAIALSFTFLLLSLLASGLVEAISALLGSRAAWLRNGIRDMIGDGADRGNDDEITDQLLNHELIAGLRPRWSAFLRQHRHPSYIPSHLFVTSLKDVLRSTTGASDLVQARSLLPQHQLQTRLQSLTSDCSSDQEAESEIASWFDATMDRVSGGFKRSRQVMLLTVGLLLAWGLQIDSLEIYQSFQEDAECRTAFVDEAGKLYEAGLPDSTGAQQLVSKLLKDGRCKNAFGGAIQPLTLFTDAISQPSDSTAIFGKPKSLFSFCESPAAAELSSVQACETAALASSLTHVSLESTSDGSARQTVQATPNPTRLVAAGTAGAGAAAASPAISEMLVDFLGLLITGFAISLGAPFWFDGLKGLLSIRAAGPRPATSAARLQSAVSTSPVVASPAVVAPLVGNGYEARMSEDDIKDLQTVLGMKITETSGRVDAVTRKYIERWQQNQSLPVTGELTQSSYETIMRA